MTAIVEAAMRQLLMHAYEPVVSERVLGSVPVVLDFPHLAAFPVLAESSGYAERLSFVLFSSPVHSTALPPIH